MGLFDWFVEITGKTAGVTLLVMFWGLLVFGIVMGVYALVRVCI